jgi:diacylglycerol kinase (ATP)
MTKSGSGKRAARRLARLASHVQRLEEARVAELVDSLAQASLARRLGMETEHARPARKRALLIINAKSGREQDSLLKLRELVDILANFGIAADVRVKLKKSFARKEAHRAAQHGYHLVIAAGGDGTVAAVARGLLGTNATLGIVPLGTYNNTASSLGIPVDLHEACALIAAGLSRRIDVGEVEATGKRKSTLFLEVAAVGLAATLTAVGQHLEKGRWDAARERLPAALALQPALARLSLDDSQTPLNTRTLLVLVANGPRMGAGLDVVPLARMDDGLLDVHVYEDADQAGLAATFVANAARLESIARTATRAYARRVRIETSSPLPVLADSKVIGTTPATCRVHAGALSVIVGNGPALSRPVADRTLKALKAAAHDTSAPSDNGSLAAEPVPRGEVIRVLSEVVPTASEVVEHARSVRRGAVPVVAAAAIGGAILAPLLRRLTRR